MPVMLERWNDDRMDGLEAKVDGLDRKVDVLARKVDGLERKVNVLAVRVGGVEDELREQRQELRELRKDTKAGFEQMGRLMAQGAIGLSSSMIVGFATVLATQL